MKKSKFSITYEVISPVSQEFYGDPDERGWYLPGGWKFVLLDNEGDYPETLNDAKNGAFNLKLSEAIREAKLLGITKLNGSALFETPDGIEDYVNGNKEFYSLHCENVTPATLRRVQRALNS